jgi:phage head maturation protease
MAHYIVTFSDDDNWGDRREKTKPIAEAQFEQEMASRPLVRLLRWHDYYLTEMRRAVDGREVEARGELGRFLPEGHPEAGQ